MFTTAGEMNPQVELDVIFLDVSSAHISNAHRGEEGCVDK